MHMNPMSMDISSSMGMVSPMKEEQPIVPPILPVPYNPVTVD